ncbi:MAG: phospho-N-acetylmuramoyl-pentapeptide-transferase [Clostridia bacterium]|nr:phospho-N-acetylmuramoyl-pentapeptide-transferase [Clostridia bacterium]
MKTEGIYTYAALFAAVLILTVLLERVLIPVLCRYRADQPILTIGPVWHMSKSGTPTMGGLAFIMALLAVFLSYAAWLLLRGERASLLAPVLVILYAAACGAIGFFDDYRKLCKRQNEGLCAMHKYLLQLLVSAALLFAARYLELIDTAIALPFTARELELGILYYPLALLFLTGMVNALNLTDGLDGLLASTVAVLGVFFFLYGNLRGEGLFSFFGALLTAAMLGFLVFNHHPARVFMGDTGSLFLGGVVASVGLLSAQPLTVLGAGGIYLAEAGSVILQVAYFKLTHGRRLFLMAPFHHHLEKKGYSENTVVVLFSLVTAILCCLMLLGR